MTARTTHPSGALDGLRVADFSRILAAPLATMVLGDLGADVVKVERPGTGDDTRTWGPPFRDGGATYFDAVNRNKRSVVLDLHTEEGRAAAQQLCIQADVVVDNFRPGTMARFGLDHDTLATDRPALVTCSISGFGSTGPGADLAGYDLLVQAMSGWMHVTGQPDGPPTKVGVAVVDQLAGLHAAIAILAALRHRDRTGEGQHVEVSLMDAALSGLVNQASGWLGAGVDPTRRGNRHPSIAPYQPYPTGDGDVVVAIGSEPLWAAFADVLGAPGLRTDPRFASNADRVANVDALEAVIVARLADDDAEAWVRRLRAHGIPAGRVETVAGAFAVAQQLGAVPVVEVPTDDGGTFRTPRSPMRLDRTPVRVRRPPPGLGGTWQG